MAGNQQVLNTPLPQAMGEIPTLRLKEAMTIMTPRQALLCAGVTALIGFVVFSPKGSGSGCTKEAWACAAEQHELTMRWGCEKAIKPGLLDPGSYKANNVSYWPSIEAAPAAVMVKLNYNASNVMGGSIPGSAVCHFDLSGNLLKSKHL